MKTYEVKKIEAHHTRNNGRLDHSLWEKANVLKDFSSPWHFEDVEDIAFRALHDGENLFLLYEVTDSALHIDTTDNSKGSIDKSDRVELFLRSNKDLNPYYCLEIDPLGRVQDFMARPDRDFDFNWHWPKHDIAVKSEITATSFSLEIVLTLASLKRFELVKEDGSIEAGIYRAKYNQHANGQFQPTWITWIDPQTEIPNFHTASSFGTLELEAFKLSKTE